MPDERLLDRQAELIEYLTTPSAFRGGVTALAGFPRLAGLDAQRLAVLGELSLHKRAEKIAAVLGRTMAHIDGDPGSLMRDFAEAFPPDSASRYDNASQFHAYLVTLWRDRPPSPAHIVDLAAFEMAFARVRLFGGNRGRAGPPPGRSAASGETRIRRDPDVELLKCRYDVRCLFDDTVAGAVPPRRTTRLAIACPEAAAGPRVFELTAALYQWLCGLDDWRAVGSSAVPAGAAGAAALVAGLADRGVVEITP